MLFDVGGPAARRNPRGDRPGARRAGERPDQSGGVRATDVGACDPRGRARSLSRQCRLHKSSKR